MNITLEGNQQQQMNTNSIKQQLNIYLAQGKINFYQLQSIVREIGQDKLMKDLTPQERDLIVSYINGTNK
jgi:hypothetical protein